MEPLNKSARTASIGKFLAMYVLSITVITLCAYFIINTPVSMLKKQLSNLKNSFTELDTLLNKVEKINSNLQNIKQADKSYLNTTNEIERGSLLANLQEYQKNINDALVDIKNDTSKLAFYPVKRNSFNYIIAFDAVLAYRNTINSLKGTLDLKGGDAAELAKLRLELENCRTALEICRIKITQPPVIKPATEQTGGSTDKQKEETHLNNLEKLQQQFALQKQLLVKLTAELASCEKEKNSGTVNESQKAAILFNTGQILHKLAQGNNNLIERRGLLKGSKKIFEQALTSYAVPDKIEQEINKINEELNALINMR